MDCKIVLTSILIIAALRVSASALSDSEELLDKRLATSQERTIHYGISQNNILMYKEKDHFEDVISKMDNALKGDGIACSMYETPSLNFKIEGRRISETKCFESIWEIKQDEDIKRRQKQCMAQYSDFTGIVGGRTAKPGEFPHMGALGWKAKRGEWMFLCGSFLISERFALTAAHCYYAEGKENVAHPRAKIVRFGVENIAKPEINKDEKPMDIKILKFIKHPNYRPLPYKTYDIALLKLAKRVTFSEYVQPACILNQQVNTGIITGWGVVDSNNMYSEKTSDMLQVAEVDIIPRRNCHCMLKEKRDKVYWKKVMSNQICATKINGTADICGGDSGGPLQAKLIVNTKTSIYNVVGLTSFGFSGCGNPDFPSIYTNVSSYIDWIEETVWEVKPAVQKTASEEDHHDEQISCKRGKQLNTKTDNGRQIHKVQKLPEGLLFWLNKSGSYWAYFNKNMVEKVK